MRLRVKVMKVNRAQLWCYDSGWWWKEMVVVYEVMKFGCDKEDGDCSNV